MRDIPDNHLTHDLLTVYCSSQDACVGAMRPPSLLLIDIRLPGANLRKG